MTTKYIETSLKLSPIQKQKIASAVKQKKGATIRLSASDFTGSDKIRLTRQQINKIRNAKSKGAGVDLKLSKTQLSKQGGFLGALLGGLAASVLPQLLGGIFGKGVVLPGSRPPRTQSQKPSVGGNGIKKRQKKRTARGLVLPGTILRRTPPFMGTWERY